MIDIGELFCRITFGLVVAVWMASEIFHAPEVHRKTLFRAALLVACSYIVYELEPFSVVLRVTP